LKITANENQIAILKNKKLSIYENSKLVKKIDSQAINLKFFNNILYLIYKDRIEPNIEIELENIVDFQLIEQDIFIARDNKIYKNEKLFFENESKIESITELSSELYVLDEKSLWHFENSKKMLDLEIEANSIIAGLGKCGNFRVFIAESKNLNVFDPFTKELKTITSLDNEIVDISKFECNIYLITKNDTFIFDLQTFELEKIIT